MKMTRSVLLAVVLATLSLAMLTGGHFSLAQTQESAGSLKIDDITRPAGTQTLSIGTTLPPSFTFSCGNGGSVTIRLDTGHVSYDKCSVDDGARAFWSAVETMFPGSVRKQ